MAKKIKKRSTKGSSHEDREPMDPKLKRELISIALFALAVILTLALFHVAGPLGEIFTIALAAIFGVLRFLIPVAIIFIAIRTAFPDQFPHNGSTLLGIFLFFTATSGLLNILIAKTTDNMLFLDTLSSAGGYFGLLLGFPVIKLAGFWAGIIILSAIIVMTVIGTLNISVQDIIRATFNKKSSQNESDNEYNEDQDEEDDIEHEEKSVFPVFRENPIREEQDTFKPIPPQKKIQIKNIDIPLSLLETRNAKASGGDIAGRQFVIQKTLENFGIPVEMSEVSIGPTVTQFTLKPADGVRLNKITTLSNDLALALAAHPIRVEAPIPGKSLVGIEVPNQSVATVSLRDVLETKTFKERSTPLAIALGKDVAGAPWIADLTKMPHLLVAGATGSGKTVCLNTIILSLLYQNSPNDLKLILIDPKRVELPVYNGIPHLLSPAITDVSKIINALKWTIGEMERRFEVLSQAGKRDISSYNESAEEKLPYIVVVIDELADLMVASAAEVEGAIIRLAQMARAVGIHLIVATQRPSVDVITGLIKANITARIAFSVASATDSRTILDGPGAEKLVGRGDMLFVSSDLSKPKRIQCCYVSDREIRNVVNYLQEQLDEPMRYEDNITEKKTNAMGFTDNSDEDELYEEARDIVVRSGKASTSLLQRRLRIGYSRAARLLDMLEERGIVGPGDGAKPRQILVSGVADSDGIHFSEDNENE